MNVADAISAIAFCRSSGVNSTGITASDSGKIAAAPIPSTARAAINAPMQGTAADIIKLAMIGVDDWCRRQSQPARLIMQVHDELVLEVRADAIEHVSAAVREHMESAAALSVPLRVDVGWGANWDEAH